MAKSKFVNPNLSKKFKKVIRNADKIIGMKVNIKDIPIMNEKIIHDLAKLNNQTIGTVDDIVKFLGRYTSNVISEGMMESVMLPHFGKFAPNIKLLQGTVRREREVRSGKFLLTLALKGKNINFKPQINPITYENPENAERPPASNEVSSQEDDPFLQPY